MVKYIAIFTQRQYKNLIINPPPPYMHIHACLDYHIDYVQINVKGVSIEREGLFRIHLLMPGVIVLK